MLEQNKKKLQAVWDDVKAAPGFTELPVYMLLESNEGNRIVCSIHTILNGSVKIINECLDDALADNNDKTLKIINRPPTAFEMKGIAEYVSKKQSIKTLELQEIKCFGYQELCILLHLKTLRSDLTIKFGNQQQFKGSGVTLWSFFVSDEIPLENAEVPSQSEHQKQWRAWASNNNNPGGTQRRRNGTQSGNQPQPVNKPWLACIASTAVGVALMGTGVGMALVGNDAAFTSLGAVNLYQALMLAGSTVVFISCMAHLFFENNRGDGSAISNIASELCTPYIGVFLRYAPAFILGTMGLIGVMVGYWVFDKAAQEGIQLSVQEAMTSAGVNTGMLTIGMFFGCTLALYKFVDKEIEKPFIAQVFAAGIAATAVSVLTPYLMVETGLFADPASTAVSVLMPMAIVPLLSILVKEIGYGVQKGCASYQSV